MRFLACFKKRCLTKGIHAYSVNVDSIVILSPFFLRNITFLSIIVDYQAKFVFV